MDRAESGTQNNERFVMNTTNALFVVTATLCLLSFGCGPSYPLSGKVTFDGQPVQKGSILFRPDEQAGNEGPSCTTKIHGGQFIIPAGSQVAPGPTIAEITDEANPDTKLVARFDFPSSPTVDFEIVAQVDESDDR